MQTHRIVIAVITALLSVAPFARADTLRGDLTRDGKLTAADLAAADVFYDDPRAFWQANPGWTLDQLRIVADVDRNGVVEASDRDALRRAVQTAGGRQPVDEHGWTHVHPTLASRVVYVSNSAGRDRNPGLSPDRPVATLARGYELLRDNCNDQLLLRAGDTWQYETINWRKTGPSHREPMLLGVYGHADRPTLVSADNHTIYFKARHLCIIGLRFEGKDKMSAVFTYGPNSEPAADLLIEDCVITGYYDGLNLQNITGATVRRCIITDTKRQGIFSAHTNDLTVAQNLLDRNGTNNILDHGLYLSGDSVRTRVLDNLICRSANFALKFNGMQTDGEIARNVAFATRNGISLGANDAHKRTTDTVARDNVLVEMGRAGQSIGFYINRSHNVAVENNLLAHARAASESIRLSGSGAGGLPNIDNLTIAGNTIHNWANILYHTDDYQNVKQQRNTFTTGDASRSVTGYAETLGQSVDQWLAAAAARPRGQWDARYTAAAVAAYMREGFVDSTSLRQSSP